MVSPACISCAIVVCKAHKWMQTFIIWVSIIYSIYISTYIYRIHITYINVYKNYIYSIYIHRYINQIYNTNTDVDGLRPLIHFVDHKFTACALWWHQKASTCNSRPRFQLLGDPLATSRALVGEHIDDFIDFFTLKYCISNILYTYIRYI